MKEKFVLVLTLVLIAATHFSCVPEEESFVSMFNGKDLTGWEGKPGGWWVEDGAITSQSTEEEPCVKHHYLFWEDGEPADFILRFKYRIVGGNSGLQFRSEKRDNYDTWGYQADIEAGSQWTGCLFQHGRKGVVMRGYRATISEDGQREEEEFAAPDELIKVVRTDDWNDYEVVAMGSRIVLRINGELMCQVDDRDKKACHDGFIALQMHPGPPMKIQFKDLYIKVLDKSP
ncbi:MAG: DUF1080 domain-containing protein [Planctomycetes bacterium]|nr:DUF1080 domain-containing protein [Planctomycetota bacterium]